MSVVCAAASVTLCDLPCRENRFSTSQFGPGGRSAAPFLLPWYDMHHSSCPGFALFKLYQVSCVLRRSVHANGAYFIKVMKRRQRQKKKKKKKKTFKGVQ